MTNSAYARLSRTEKTALLRDVIGRCNHTASSSAKQQTPTPVVVFDLDGTLLDNRPRTAAILHEFASHVSDADFASRLRNAKTSEIAYLLADSLEQLGIRKTEWIAEAERFWRERFFADPHLAHDVEVPGAVAFARACYEAGAIVVYLTGRDLPLMGIGTFQSLRDRGFPIGVPGTELVLKPDASMPDEAYKRLMAPKMARVGNIVASFDNEPANCNVFLSSYPGAHSVLIDTQHLPGAPLLDSGVLTIDDFMID